MSRFVCFGCPVGFEMSKHEKNDEYKLKMQHSKLMSGIHIDKYNIADDTYYLYTRFKNKGKDFLNSNGRTGSHFGMAIIFNKREHPDDKKVFNLLHQAYEQFVKGNIIEHYPNGNMRYKINHIYSDDNKVANDLVNKINKMIQQYQIDIFKGSSKEQTAQNTQGNSPNMMALKKNDPRGK